MLLLNRYDHASVVVDRAEPVIVYIGGGSSRAPLPTPDCLVRHQSDAVDLKQEIGELRMFAKTFNKTFFNER